MKEHLALQKSMAKLQGMLGYRADPERYTKVCLGQKKKYVCLLFDENFKRGRSVDFLFYFIFIFYLI